jgi:hypothetical protein
MKNLEKRFLMVSPVLPVPALRELAKMMRTLAEMGTAFTVRSLEREPVYARVKAAKRKIQCCF